MMLIGTGRVRLISSDSGEGPVMLLRYRDTRGNHIFCCWFKVSLMKCSDDHDDDDGDDGNDGDDDY